MICFISIIFIILSNYHYFYFFFYCIILLLFLFFLLSFLYCFRILCPLSRQYKRYRIYLHSSPRRDRYCLGKYIGRTPALHLLLSPPSLLNHDLGDRTFSSLKICFPTPTERLLVSSSCLLVLTH